MEVINNNTEFGISGFDFAAQVPLGREGNPYAVRFFYWRKPANLFLEIFIDYRFGLDAPPAVSVIPCDYVPANIQRTDPALAGGDRELMDSLGMLVAECT